ncbi:unnamed protein product [Mytilus coruscus]|uniref:Uncharacterized protein n=1 Tax=Mytilus coruscus TaxID=42192 RepID=A0A6J8CMS4_MYTCO|nr:unnamed protein product [Mytilus coruscus]
MRHPTDTNRHSYVTTRNKFNKAKRNAQFNYKKRKGLELCNIAKREPRKFWSAVKPKNRSNCLVENDEMLNYFEKILGSNPPELCDEVLHLLNNTDFGDIKSCIKIQRSNVSEVEECIAVTLKHAPAQKNGPRYKKRPETNTRPADQRAENQHLE